jgi:anti-anti-sigma factor
MSGTDEGSLQVLIDQRGHVTHLRLSGELDMATSPLLEERLHGAEANGNTSIVLDLVDVTFMDVSGLHAFIAAAERAARRGSTFAIVKAPRVVRRLLQLTGTTDLLGAEPPTLDGVFLALNGRAAALGPHVDHDPVSRAHGTLAGPK